MEYETLAFLSQGLNVEISTLLCKALDHVCVGLLVVFTGLPVRTLDNRSRQLNLWPGSRCVGLLGCRGGDWENIQVRGRD